MKQITHKQLNKAIELLASAKANLYTANGELPIDDNIITKSRTNISKALKLLGE